MLVSAICAHTLNFRLIILPDTIVLRVGVPYDARTSSWASFDGRERYDGNVSSIMLDRGLTIDKSGAMPWRLRDHLGFEISIRERDATGQKE